MLWTVSVNVMACDLTTYQKLDHILKLLAELEDRILALERHSCTK